MTIHEVSEQAEALRLVEELEFGKALRNLRHMTDTTWIEFTEKVGCSSSYLHLIETEQRIPSEKVVDRIGNFLSEQGIQVTALLKAKLRELKLKKSLDIKQESKAALVAYILTANLNDDTCEEFLVRIKSRG